MRIERPTRIQTPAGTSIQRWSGPSDASTSFNQVSGASIFCSRESPLAAPRTTSMVPSVTMNGTTRSRVTRAPFASPQSAHTATARPAASQGQGPEAQSLRNQAMTTVLSATIEPTDKSMPPEMMTSVIPSAAMPTMVVWRAMVSRLRDERKLSGPMIANSAKTAIRPSSGPNRPSSRPPGRGDFGFRVSDFGLHARASCPVASSIKACSSISRHRSGGAEFAAAHHGDAVADARQFGQVAADDQHGLGLADPSRRPRGHR